MAIQAKKDKSNDLADLDFKRWERYATIKGYDFGDTAAYVQWSGSFGNIREIETLITEIRNLTFDRKTVLLKAYNDPEDKEILDAEFAFDDPSMRLRYPVEMDSVYPNGKDFNIAYLANLPLGSTALFDDRRVISTEQTLAVIEASGAGSIDGKLTSSTVAAQSITTDWSASASGSYGFFRLKASASEHKSVTEEFQKSTEIQLKSEAALRVSLKYGGWFRPALFRHKYVIENVQDFREFFGEQGTLLYYPTGFVIVRGFSVMFKSAQAWTYDYERRFSASGGGGMNFCGIGFGGSASYSSTVKEHKVSKSGTELTISDDPSNIRFVGYIVKKNKVWQEEFMALVAASLTDEVVATLV